MADDPFYVAQSAQSPFIAAQPDPGPDTVYSTADVNRIQDFQNRPKSGLARAFDYVRSWLPHADEQAGRQSLPDALENPHSVSLAARLEDAPRRALNIATGIPDAMLGATGHYMDWQHQGRDAHADFDPLSVAVGPITATGLIPGLGRTIARGEANPISTADWVRAKYHGSGLDDFTSDYLNAGQMPSVQGGGVQPPIWPGEDFVGDKADINQQNPYSPRAAKFRQRMEDVGRFGETYPRAPEFEAGHHWDPAQGNIRQTWFDPLKNDLEPFSAKDLRELRGIDSGPSAAPAATPDLEATTRRALDFFDRVERGAKEAFPEEYGPPSDAQKYESAAEKQAADRDRRSKIKVVNPSEDPTLKSEAGSDKVPLLPGATPMGPEEHKGTIPGGRRTEPLPLTQELMGWIKDAGWDYTPRLARGKDQTDYLGVPDEGLQRRGIKQVKFRVPSDGHYGFGEPGLIDTGNRIADKTQHSNNVDIGRYNAEGGPYSDRQNLKDVVKWALSHDPDGGNWLVPQGKEPQWARYDQPPRWGPFAGAEDVQKGAETSQQLQLLAKNSGEPLIAAFRVRDGKGGYRTFTGDNHGEAYDRAVGEMGQEAVDRGTYQHESELNFHDDPYAGFLTRDGAYATRRQSYQALKDKGVDVSSIRDKALTSEDLADIKSEQAQQDREQQAWEKRKSDPEFKRQTDELYRELNAKGGDEKNALIGKTDARKAAEEAFDAGPYEYPVNQLSHLSRTPFSSDRTAPPLPKGKATPERPWGDRTIDPNSQAMKFERAMREGPDKDYVAAPKDELEERFPILGRYANAMEKKGDPLKRVQSDEDFIQAGKKGRQQPQLPDDVPGQSRADLEGLAKRAFYETGPQSKDKGDIARLKRPDDFDYHRAIQYMRGVGAPEADEGGTLHAKTGGDSWWQKIIGKFVGRDPEDPALSQDPKDRMNQRLARRIINEPEVAKAAGDFYAKDRGPNDTLHGKTYEAKGALVAGSPRKYAYDTQLTQDLHRVGEEMRTKEGNENLPAGRSGGWSGEHARPEYLEAIRDRLDETKPEAAPTPAPQTGKVPKYPGGPDFPDRFKAAWGKHAGHQGKMAAELGISQNAVSRWANRIMSDADRADARSVNMGTQGGPRASLDSEHFGQRFAEAWDKYEGHQASIAKELGISPNAVSTYRVKYGYAPKNRSRGMIEARRERNSQVVRSADELEQRGGKPFWDEKGKLEAGIEDQAAALKAARERGQ